MLIYRLIRTPDGHREFALGDVPPYCHSLPMAPPSIEPELQSGTWLILLSAIWSMPDMAAISVALAIAREFGGKIQLGIRPFNDHREAKPWCPQMQQEFVSPVWLLLCDGQLVAEQSGSRGKNEMVSWIKGILHAE